MTQHAVHGFAAPAAAPQSRAHAFLPVEIDELIAYCDALQALVGSSRSDDQVLEYLTPYGFHMLIDPVKHRLATLKEVLAAA